MSIEYIKKNKTSSMDWTVIETLRATADALESGEREYNKCVLCMLDDNIKTGGRYTPSFRVAQMSIPEAIALLEITKQDLLNILNGVA